MSEVHISLSEFDAIRNSQKEGQDRIKELEKIISEKDDLITKLGYNKTKEKLSIFGILLKLLDSRIRVIITNCVYVAYILVLQWFQNGQLLVKRKRLSMVTFHGYCVF